MKKRIILLLMVLTVAVGLSGCTIREIVFGTSNDDNKITIEFDTSLTDETIEPMKVDKGSKVELPTPKDKNKTFVKWIDQNGVKADNDTVFNQDTKLFAVWKKKATKKSVKKTTKKTTKKSTTTKKNKTVTITYVPFNGNKDTKVTYTCKNNSITFKSKKVSKDGYVLRVWEDGYGKPILNGKKLDCKNLTVYAHWDAE